MERFWNKVHKTASCWEWTGTKSYGYGIFYVGRRPRRAHRYLWEQIHGPIPNKMVIMHVCDNRACVNPEHLRCDTQKANILDAVAKDRMHNGHGSPLGQDHPQAKLSDDDVRAILKQYKEGTSQATLARKYAVSRQSIHNIVRFKNWQHLT